MEGKYPFKPLIQEAHPEIVKPVACYLSRNFKFAARDAKSGIGISKHIESCVLTLELLRCNDTEQE